MVDREARREAEAMAARLGIPLDELERQIEAGFYEGSDFVDQFGDLRERYEER